MNLPAEEERFATLRLRMVETQLRARGVADGRVLAAMSRVPRHEFAPPQYRDQAYEDYPLPIGEDQTISQPYIVALMLQALALTPADRVLEVGTGSGYMAALLAEVAAQVVSVERFASLADRAGETLRRLGYTNLEIVSGDGTQGFPAKAPFDAIVVSAAAPIVPPALLMQLAETGRMVIPIGPADSQQLQLIHMQNHEPRIQLRELCRFVPLVSGHGA